MAAWQVSVSIITTPIAEMPVYFMDSENADIYYNSKIAEKMGLELPAEIIEKGIDVAK